MKCPFCGKDANKVIDTRESEETIRRRRECLNCKRRFTTYERIAQTGLMVIKQDARRETFDRQKLLGGIVKACAKRPVSMEAIEATVDQIELDLHTLGKSEIDSQKIGQMLMEKLRVLDDVAYVRFASVYRRFADLDSLASEIQRLKEKKQREVEERLQTKLGI
ncbi:MAG: transcriptional repressor NrdR [Chloroflexi bacterium]|nr:transcriptional repressor NrdR [Chloroflexota bacterium]MBI3740913.1 transcriptional repressor NrdR [Chloroflexota bacterium]